MTAVILRPIPAFVWLDHTNHTAHAPVSAAVTGCGVLTRSEGSFIVAEDLWRWTGAWCRVCWPGRRCRTETRDGHCGVPSGGHTECAVHLREAIDRDKRIARAA